MDRKFRKYPQPKKSQQCYDNYFNVIVLKNYAPGEALETSIQAMIDAMYDHADMLLKHPELFE